MALLGFVGVYTFVKTDAEAKYERAEQGEEVYESDAGLETILFLLGARLAAGAAAGAFVFRRLGGKLPVEYVRGLSGE